MANLFIFIPKSQPYTDDDVDPAEVYEDGQIHRFESTDSDELAAANRIIADGAGFDVSELVSALIQVSWANITGKPSTFAPSSHEHAGEDITSGTVAAARIAALAASKITSGTFDTARIPGLDAAKIISGALDALRIPDLDAAKIATGILALARIPDLSTAKITSGEFDDARIPDLAAAKIISGIFDVARIPDLNTSKVTEGTFHNDRISVGSVTQHEAALTVALSQVSDAGDMAGKDTVATADIDANAVTEDKLSTSVAEKLNRSAKNNFTATTDPDADNDTTEGYSEGSKWVNKTSDESFVCLDATEGAAIWANTSLTADDLGSLAFQEASNVNITGGVISVTSATIGGVTISGGDVDGRDVSADGSKLDGIETGATADQTGAEIKTAYEGEADTNAFTDAEKSKLAAIEASATADQTGAEIKTAYEAEDDTNAFTDAEKTKLGNVAAGATANETDAHLLARANHTGSQAIATISGLQTALDAKVALANLPFASVAEYTSTDTTTDLADASGAVIQWDTSRSTDSAITIGGTNDTELSFAADGKYRVSVRLSYEDTSAEDTDVDNSVGLFFKLNGTGTGGQGIGSVVANSAGANEGQVWFEQVINITDYENQVITVCTQRLSGADELYLRSGESTLIVEKIGGKSSLLAAQDISDIEGLVAALQAKANATDIYTQTEITDLLAGKTSVTDMAEALAARVTTSAFMATLGDYSTTTAITALLADKLDASARGATDGVASLSGGKVPIGELPTGTSTDQLVTLDSSGKLPSGVMPDGVGGGGLTVAAIKTSAFTPVIGEITPVDSSGGGITLTGLPASPSYGNEFALVCHDFSWSPANPVTVPGTDTINGQTRDIILDAPAKVAFRWAGENFGWEATIILLEETADYVEPHIATPTITSPADSATDVIETPTITSSAFATVNGSDTHAHSDWKVTSDDAGATVVVQSLDDSSNKVSWTVPSGNLSTSTTYYVWVRHSGTTYGDSDWSLAVSFTTAAAFADPDAQAIFDAMSSEPDATRKGHINTLVEGLKSDSLWSVIDVLGLTAAHASQAALLNWVDPGGTAMSAVNTPTFPTDSGAKSDGSAAYIDTNFDPSTAGGNYSQNSGMLGVWVKTVASGTGYYAGVSATYSVLIQHGGAGVWRARGPNTGNSILYGSVTSASADGFLVVNRSGASAREIYRNGTLDVSDTQASTGVADGNIFVLGFNTGSGAGVIDSSATISAVVIAGSMDATQQSNLHSRINTYLTAIGAI